MNNIIFVLLGRIRTPIIALIVVYAISILGFVLIPGVDESGNPWRMGFFHAFYFVSYMSTTIGFGEIPYAFTDSQRLWATLCMYGSVFAWLYAIGSLLALIQDDAFRHLVKANRFRRSVRRLNEPFFLVCGFGDTGSFLVRALCDAGIRSVVIDVDQNRVNELELSDFRLYVPAICADASDPRVLVSAGLKHSACVGIVALTDVDDVNLKIAITSKLLHPSLEIIARAETQDAAANIASFGTDHIINPFDIFAGRLALALHAPAMYLLFEWMTEVPYEKLIQPVFPPRGHWILCGYGRFGKAVYDRLRAAGTDVTVIEADPERTNAPPTSVTGRGTEAVTLREANIDQAVGIVAGTDDDANNLSIILTARELNPQLFFVARQNQRGNDMIFNEVELDLVMRRGSVIAHKIYALIANPSMADFFRLATHESNSWAKQLVSRISEITGEVAPHTWTREINERDAPAVYAGLQENIDVDVEHFYADPRNRDNRLDCIALLIKRKGEEILLPQDHVRVQAHDRVLFCGTTHASRHTDWFAKNHNVFDYVCTGDERPSGLIWRLFSD